MRSSIHYTSQGLLSTATALAIFLAVWRRGGVVLAAFAVILAVCYALASLLSNRARLNLAIVALFFASLPWLGLGHGEFVAMGPHEQILPTIQLPNTIHNLLFWPYWAAETPLYILAEYSDACNEVICFAGEGLMTVRPFVVFVYWLGIGLAIVSPAAASLVRLRRRGDVSHSMTPRCQPMPPTITIDGLVQQPATLAFADLAAWDEAGQVRDMSRIDPKRKGDALRLSALLDRVKPRAQAKYLTLHASRDDFHASIPLEAVRERALLIYQLDGQPLPESAGGPVRFYIPDFAACHTSEIDECANVKFVDRIELTATRGQDNRPHDEKEHAELHERQG